MVDNIGAPGFVEHRGSGTAKGWRGRLAFGSITLAALIFTAVAAPLLAPHDPLAQDLFASLLPPAWQEGADPQYLLGTDSLGRDILSRLIYGARVAAIVAIAAAALAGLLGTTLGLLAGFYGGWIDQVISRLVDIWMAFPPVLLSVILVAVIGAGLHSVIIAIVIVDWTRFCRVIRAETMVQRQRDYVQAGKILGLSQRALLLREVLPNVLPVLLVLFTLEMGIAVIVEAILSFVGLSVASDAPTWGGLIQESRQYVHSAWWAMALPMALIIILVLGFNALGDGLKARFDPVARK